MVESETRRRSAEKLGRERVASYGVPKLAEEVDFLRASDTEMAALTRSQVGSHFAGGFSFQPLFDRITREQPDLFD